jgi:hypothetical protein
MTLIRFSSYKGSILLLNLDFMNSVIPQSGRVQGVRGSKNMIESFSLEPLNLPPAAVSRLP